MITFRKTNLTFFQIARYYGWRTDSENTWISFQKGRKRSGRLISVKAISRSALLGITGDSPFWYVFILFCSVADPFHFDTDPDPDPRIRFR